MTDAPIILVTRAQPGANETAKRLAARGWTPLASPVLTITSSPSPGPGPDDATTGLVFTSANGVRAFAHASARRDLTAWCVGPATLAAARAAGFADLRHANGNADDLRDLICAQADREAGQLLHVANADAAGQLVSRLQERGFRARFWPLYRAVAATELVPNAREALDNHAISVVLMHSARGAEAFTRLANEADFSRTHLIGVSPAAIAPARALSWASVHAANRPNESALLQKLETILSQT